MQATTAGSMHPRRRQACTMHRPPLPCLVVLGVDIENRNLRCGPGGDANEHARPATPQLLQLGCVGRCVMKSMFAGRPLVGAAREHRIALCCEVEGTCE